MILCLNRGGKKYVRGKRSNGGKKGEDSPFYVWLAGGGRIQGKGKRKEFGCLGGAFTGSQRKRTIDHKGLR